MHHLGDLTNSVTNFMATDITSTTISLSWSPPTVLIPISYEIDRRCRRLCETLVESVVSVSSPYLFHCIHPYSQCGFDLNGYYGKDKIILASNEADTLSTSKLLL